MAWSFEICRWYLQVGVWLWQWLDSCLVLETCAFNVGNSCFVVETCVFSSGMFWMNGTKLEKHEKNGR